MIKLDTLVLIDFFNVESLDPDMYDIEQHIEAYKKITEYIENIVIVTGITDVVYSAYGSMYELNYDNTDNFFKTKHLFPTANIERHAIYNIYEKPELFKDKSILVGGNSFFSCVRQRPLGLTELIKSELPRDVWSSPGITGYYTQPGETPNSLFDKTGVKLPLVIALENDFRQDESFIWRKAELTDNHSIFKVEHINSNI